MSAARRKFGPARSAPVFAALGDETRLRLLARLCADAPLSIANLTSASDISRQAITKHLHVLAKAGLVRGRRQGREQLYQPETKQMDQARQYLEIISRQWDDALTSLKQFVEDR